MCIKVLDYQIFNSYPKWPVEKQIVVNTINPHSFCVSKLDKDFKQAIQDSYILIPDGTGIVLAVRILKNIKINRIAGADMHKHLLEEVQKNRLKIFYIACIIHAFSLM